MAFPRKAALVLFAMVMIVAAWIAMRKPPSSQAPTLPAVGERPAAAAPATAPATDEDTRRVVRARWEDRRARIRAVHPPRLRDDAAASHAAPSRDCTDGDCSPDAAEHGGDAVFNAFVDETTTLTQGCEELLGGRPTPVRIEARLIGAPDVGTIVESVAVSGRDESLDALSECLTEGMYTLELGNAATSFQRDAVLMHGLLDDIAAEGWLTPERVVEIRQQMIDGGLDPAKDPMVSVNADEPSSTP